MQIRQERRQDADTIRTLTDAAFKGMPFSDQTEARVIDALRKAGALTLSLVATEAGEIIGHVAFSPVKSTERRAIGTASDPCPCGLIVSGRG